MKKRVAHVTFDMGIGGAEQVIFHLITNTDNNKFDLSVICINQPVGPFGKKLIGMDYNVTGYNRKPGFDTSLIKNIRRHIIHNNIDVLHCHQYTPYIYGLISSIGTGKKVIFTEHGRFYPDKRKLKRILINPLLSLFTTNITAISSATRDALVKFENFSFKKIEVIYNGISDYSFADKESSRIKQSLGIGENTYILGTVARLDTIKNQKIMINALKEIHKYYPETCLIIVGDGPIRNDLELLTSSLQLNSNVIFTGFKENAQDYLNIMDIFLLTSLSEGTAMTILEAMALRKPCIATDVGGNPEIVEEGKTGFLIPSNDESALVNRICTMLKNLELREVMGNAGRERFEKYFRVEKMVKSYESLYE